MKDYKQTSTSHMLSLKVENNEKCLGQWWEGLENEVYRGVKVWKSSRIFPKDLRENVTIIQKNEC